LLISSALIFAMPAPVLSDFFRGPELYLRHNPRPKLGL
jgi:hypothetical protein